MPTKEPKAAKERQSYIVRVYETGVDLVGSFRCRDTAQAWGNAALVDHDFWLLADLTTGEAKSPLRVTEPWTYWD